MAMDYETHPHLTLKPVTGDLHRSVKGIKADGEPVDDLSMSCKKFLQRWLVSYLLP